MKRYNLRRIMPFQAETVCDPKPVYPNRPPIPIPPDESRLMKRTKGSPDSEQISLEVSRAIALELLWGDAVWVL